MSTWHATAIQRRGIPSPDWPSIYGETASEATAAQAITLDLTPNLLPLPVISQELERYFLSSSFGSVDLDLSDPDGALLALLGPGGMFDYLGGYYGPWIQIEERWGTSSSAVRFLGYLDETTIERSEEEGGRLKCTAYPVMQMLAGRRLADDSALLRPYPVVPGTGTSAFTAQTADQLLYDFHHGYNSGADWGWEIRNNALAIEQTLWASCKLSWKAWMSIYQEWEFGIGTTIPSDFRLETIRCPSPLSDTIVIGEYTYSVLDVVPTDDVYIEHYVDYTDSPWGGGIRLAGRYDVCHIVLSPLNGAPIDLADAGLDIGTTVTWGVPTESRRSHFTLASDVPAPTGDEDGQSYIDLNSVDALVPGDTLRVVTYSTSGDIKRLSTDFVVADLDGELRRAHVTEPINTVLGYNVVRIRRLETDPVYVDALTVAERVVSPLALDLTQFQDAKTLRPTFMWLPMITGARSIFGSHRIQTLVPATCSTDGTVQILRRGNSTASSGYEGNFVDGWDPVSDPPASLALQILADVCQWPGANGAYVPPVLYIENNISGDTPVNGWRSMWRSWPSVIPSARPVLTSTWNGSAISWTIYSPGDPYEEVPETLVAYTATVRPGRWTRTVAGTWTFEAHSADETWSSPTSTGWTNQPPSGDWLALGWWPRPIVDGGRYVDTEALAGVYQDEMGTHAVLIDPTTGQIDASTDYLLYTETVPAVWSIHGGLIMQSWSFTLDQEVYPSTRIYLPDPVLHEARGVDLLGLEVCPGSVCALSLGQVVAPTGYPITYPLPMKITGWLFLAIETYVDENGSLSRRVRFVTLNYQLDVTNGDPQAHLVTPDVMVRVGDIVLDPAPDGAIVANMVRTGDGDRCLGVLGGRAFQAGYTMPRTLERIKLGDLTGQDFLETLGACLLCSPVPQASGGLSLISRQAGTFYTRDSGGQRGSFWPNETLNPTTSPVARAFLSEVCVTYGNVLTGDTETVTVSSIIPGGKPLDIDVSALVFSAPTARAVGTLLADHFGPICPVLRTTLREEIPGGISESLAPPFWAEWHVGGRVVSTPGTPGALTYTWKITSLEPDPDGRSCAIEAVRLPLREAL